MHTNFNHRNIWSGLEYTTSGIFPAIQSPSCHNGDIIYHCARNEHINKLALIYGAAKGLEDIHKHGFAHGSVTPNIILIDDDGEACISDAGVFYLFLKLYSPPGRNPIPPLWQYRPAEQLEPQEDQGLRMAQAADVYMFASATYEVYAGRGALAQYFLKQCRTVYLAIYGIIETGHMNIPKPSSMCAPLWHIIQRCWDRDPWKRPSMAYAVREISKLA